MATLACMEERAKKGAGRKSSSGRHKAPRNMTNVREPFIGPLEVLKERRGFRTLTDLINQLIREGLEREHLWPPESAGS